VFSDGESRKKEAGTGPASCRSADEPFGQNRSDAERLT
jgi:hypothetical protein